LLLIWQIVVPYLCSKILNKLNNVMREDYEMNEEDGYLNHFLGKNRIMIVNYLPRIISFVEIIQNVHVAIFYFTGAFYHVSKRLTSTRYIYNRKIEEYRPSYSFLGLLIFIQLSITLIIWLKNQAFQKLSVKDEKRINISRPKENEVISKGICLICSDPRVYTTATICGHLYCWDCITKWCLTRSICPYCRTPQKLNQLVRVYGI